VADTNLPVQDIQNEVYDATAKAWKVQGPVASDAAEVGNPVPVGGSVDDTTPASAAEGDRRAFRSTPEGNQIVELYKDNTALSPIAAMPGASEVKSIIKATATDSSVRATAITPTSGKKVRIISVVMVSLSTTAVQFGIHFGTGATILTTPANAIALADLDRDAPVPNAHQEWPDGAGPVGAADAVVSIRTSADIGSNGLVLIHYREE
jgi:hypothetical protein